MTLQPEALPKPVATDIPQPGTPIGQVKPYQPQPVQPAKPATGAPVASAREQVIDQKAERERMEREIRAELERERAEAAKAKAATQTAAADGGRYMMQCAALRSQDSAESLKARIAFGAGLSSSLQVVNGANGTVYKVMVGPFSGKAAVDAADVAPILGRKKIQPEKIVHEDQVGVATGMYYTPAGGDNLLGALSPLL